MRSILTKPDTTMAEASAAAASRRVQRASEGPRSASSAPVSEWKLSSTAASARDELVSRSVMFKLAQGVAVLLGPEQAVELAALEQLAMPSDVDGAALIED